MPKRSFEKMTAPARYLIIIGAAVIFALVGCIVMSAVSLRLDDPTAHLSFFGEIIFVLTMLICAFLGAKTAPESKFFCGMICSAILLLAVVAASVALGGTSFIKEVIIASVGVVAAISGALMGAKEKKRKRKR